MRLYDSLTRSKRELEPATGTVSLYVCGITTSDYSHLGHAFSSLVFEVLHRYLEYRGYSVKRVQNFTDVDDKIIARAEREGLPVEKVAEKYIEAFLTDMDALNIRRADLYPRATEEIAGMIALIKDLQKRGYAYEEGGSVYFRISRASEYGKLSRRSRDEMLQGTRVDLEPGKEDPADFVLWKASKPGEPSWDSPWGAGRPGWHIECSAMVKRYLGETVDIHGGGIDLIFPHHENEIAQSEAHTGTAPFARNWVHNGLIRLSGEKMSKSLGNLVRVRDALETYSPDAIRLWMLGSHYRSPLLYDERGISSQERAMRRLRIAANVESSAAAHSADPAPFKEAFVTAMDDDLNTPEALAATFDLARQINRSRDAGLSVTAAQAALRELAGVLGLTLEAPAAGESPLTDEEIEQLVKCRSDLRTERRFTEADSVRAELAEGGVALTDSAEGTSWSRV